MGFENRPQIEVVYQMGQRGGYLLASYILFVILSIEETDGRTDDDVTQKPPADRCCQLGGAVDLLFL